jgi:hypothetical protein
MTKFVMPAGSDCTCGGVLRVQEGGEAQVCDKCNTRWGVKGGLLIANPANPACPECDKLASVADKSQVIGEFIDWLLGEKQYILAKWGTGEVEDMLLPRNPSVQGLLAEFFGIDLKKVEVERRALLDAIRERGKS